MEDNGCLFEHTLFNIFPPSLLSTALLTVDKSMCKNNIRQMTISLFIIIVIVVIAVVAAVVIVDFMLLLFLFFLLFLLLLLLLLLYYYCCIIIIVLLLLSLLPLMSACKTSPTLAYLYILQNNK